MHIRVRLFAMVRDRAQVSGLALELREGATVVDALALLGERLPSAVELLPRCAFAINQSYVPREHILRDGDELAVIPPVSGG